jgi:hypothetical protein
LEDSRSGLIFNEKQEVNRVTWVTPLVFSLIPILNLAAAAVMP